LFMASPFPSTFGLLLARSWSISIIYHDHNAKLKQALLFASFYLDMLLLRT